MLKVPKSNSAWLERYKLPKWGGAAPSSLTRKFAEPAFTLLCGYSASTPCPHRRWDRHPIPRRPRRPVLALVPPLPGAARSQGLALRRWSPAGMLVASWCTLMGRWRSRPTTCCAPPRRSWGRAPTGPCTRPPPRARSATGFCSGARGAAAGLHGHDILPRQHKKPTWIGMDLDDTVYKVYGPKKPL